MLDIRNLAVPDIVAMEALMNILAGKGFMTKAEVLEEIKNRENSYFPSIIRSLNFS